MRTNRPRSPFGVLLALVVIATIGYVDYVTGVEIVLSLLYIIPVVAAAWWSGRAGGIIAAVAAAAAQFGVDAALGLGRTFPVLVWNDGSRLVIYVGAAVLVSRLYDERERLREHDRQREEFLQVLETELRRPSSAMDGALNGLEAQLPMPTPPQRDALRAIRHYARDVAFLAGDFLAIGNLQAGRPSMELREIDIRQLVRDAIRESREPGRIALVTSADALPVRADEDRLRHALASVISSALEIPNVEVNLHLRESGAEVALDLNSRSNISEKEVQLARLLWEANGGMLTVNRGVLGGGTSVRMRIPRARVAAESPV